MNLREKIEKIEKKHFGVESEGIGMFTSLSDENVDELVTLFKQWALRLIEESATGALDSEIGLVIPVEEIKKRIKKV